MKEDFIEPERIRAIQKAICAFLLDKVINPKGKFYADHMIGVGQLNSNMDDDEDQSGTSYVATCNT